MIDWLFIGGGHKTLRGCGKKEKGRKIKVIKNTFVLLFTLDSQFVEQTRYSITLNSEPMLQSLTSKIFRAVKRKFALIDAGRLKAFVLVLTFAEECNIRGDVHGTQSLVFE